MLPQGPGLGNSVLALASLLGGPEKLPASTTGQYHFLSSQQKPASTGRGLLSSCPDWLIHADLLTAGTS